MTNPGHPALEVVSARRKLLRRFLDFVLCASRTSSPSSPFDENRDLPLTIRQPQPQDGENDPKESTGYVYSLYFPYEVALSFAVHRRRVNTKLNVEETGASHDTSADASSSFPSPQPATIYRDDSSMMTGFGVLGVTLHSLSSARRGKLRR